MISSGLINKKFIKMDVQKEISLRNAISYCIENNDANTATNRIMEFIRDEKEAINYTHCCTELKVFKKGDKVIACNKLEGTVVSSDTQTMVKVNIKGTTISINARSLELKSI